MLQHRCELAKEEMKRRFKEINKGAKDQDLDEFEELQEDKDDQHYNACDLN